MRLAFSKSFGINKHIFPAQSSRQRNTEMDTRLGESGNLASSKFRSQTAQLHELHHLFTLPQKKIVPSAQCPASTTCMLSFGSNDPELQQQCSFFENMRKQCVAFILTIYDPVKRNKVRDMLGKKSITQSIIILQLISFLKKKNGEREYQVFSSEDHLLSQTKARRSQKVPARKEVCTVDLSAHT